MIIDNDFLNYFNKKLKQVFLYITDNCQLHCKQCLYKPLLKNKNDMNYDHAIALLKVFKSLGALKLTLIGGEPTTYDLENNNNNLFKLIKEAKVIGYKYIRMDTNGQFDPIILENNFMKKIDEITFSLDGYDSRTNDIVRGKGTFEKCISNIKKAIHKTYNVHITNCVHSKISDNNLDKLYFEKMIKFAESLGVNTLNFHPIIKVGIPRDDWIEDTDLSPQEWVEIYNDYREKNLIKPKINVRIPQRFIDTDEYIANKKFFNYCPVDLAERVLVHANGDIRICAFRIGTNISIAKYSSNRITWESQYNELDIHKKEKYNICSAQHLNDDLKIPLCMSFKPNQKEIIWNLLHDQEVK
jgi:MoaA/NifB/PqqE/SkfB family radical SAM enzyme